MQTATRIPDATRQASPHDLRLAPLSGNAFRLLGLSCHASQKEIYAAASSLRRALKLGVARTHAADIAWLGAHASTENGVRDALSRLTVPAQRIYERLFWFFDPGATLAAAVSPDLAALHESLVRLRASESAAVRHDAALLALAVMHRLDPALRLADEWRRTYTLWKEVIERREFWSLLMAADLKGDFEQTTTFAEIADLRARAWRLVTAPLAEIAKDAILSKDYEQATRALAILRTSALPQTLADEYEQEILGPVEDEFDVTLATTFLTYRYEVKTHQSVRERRETCYRALAKFNESIRPALRKILELGGIESAVVRRIFSTAAEFLDELADGFDSGFDHGSKLRMLRKARQLAPPESATLLLVEEHLAAAGDASERQPKTEEAYASQLRAALREPLSQPDLFTAYIQQGEAEKSRQRRGQVVGRFILFIMFALAVGKCFNSLPGSRRPRALRPLNFNVSVPRFTPQPMPKFSQLVDRVTADELRAELKAKTATLFHVGAKDEYDAGHIPGALWMPESEAAARVKRLPKSRHIVLYCDCDDEGASTRTAFLLRASEHANVSVLDGGYRAWLDAGLPSVPATAPPTEIEAVRAPPQASFRQGSEN